MEADARRGLGQVDVLLVEPDRRVVTNGRGEFRFDSVAPGQHRLRVRHLGYRSRELTVDVPAGQILGVTIQLDPEPVALDPLDVQVESELRIPRLAEEGYYYRRELNFGHFFGPQYLTRWAGTRVSDILARTPGFVRRGRVGRSTIINWAKGCTPSLVVNGRSLPTNGWVLNAPATEIAAIEVYKGPSETVGILHGGGGCGLILVWTWRGPNPFHDSVGEGYACPERLKRFRAHAC